MKLAKKNLYRSVSACALIALGTVGSTGVASAADVAAPDAGSTGIEEITVTADRRNESIQSVPSTIQAFSGKMLEDLNITSLDDLVKVLPNVAFPNNGPGQGNIYIRGLSAGFAGNQSSATIGNFPNVALYLDDQSMQFPSRNVDIYAADLERIEVLEGPQGTLFGGGAEAGAVRYITNKPKLNVFESKVEAGYSFTNGGDPNDNVTATINVPLVQDKLSARLVIYNDRQGGYINNVPSTFTRNNNDLGNFYFNIKPNAQGICPNNKPAGTAGLCTLASAPQANNFAIAGNAQNPTTYTGGRLSALYEISDDWELLVTQSLQNLDAEGLSSDEQVGSDFQTLKPLQVTAFSPSFDHDDFENTAWTVNGKIADLKVVYTGAYMDRHITQQQDYTNYSRSAGGAYYACTGGTGGLLGKGAPTCFSPIGSWLDTVRNTHLSNEVRVSTPDDGRIRAIGGVFQETFRIYDVQNFNYKTIPSCNAANLAVAQAGGQPCLADVTPAPGATTNVPGIRSDTTAFGEDVQRGYDQYALFGSLDFDVVPDVLTVTAGTRWYHYSEFEVGSQYATGGGCLNVPNGECVGGLTNINAHNDKQDYQGFKSRANVTWHIDQDEMAYFTFSQGFRPGGFNRAVSAVGTGANGTPQFERPNGYAPDSLTNYEIGSKTELFDRRLLLNLSAYYMQWDNVQFNFFNPTELGNTTFGTNGPNYDIKGAEAQFTAKATEALTFQGSGSYNDDTQANSPCLIGNIPGNPSNGQCITQVLQKGVGLVPFQNPFGTVGSVPAFSPYFKGNLRARYDWQIDQYKFFASVGADYTGSMFNQPSTYPSGAGVLIPNTTTLRYEQPAYTLLDAALNVAKDNWSIGLFGTNLTNSQASTFTSSAQFIKSEVPVRPRVIGLKASTTF